MPLPDFTANFPSEEISNTQKLGTISSSRDSFNNILLNLEQTTVSGSLISIPLTNVTYSDKYIESFYETKFTEFVENP